MLPSWISVIPIASFSSSSRREAASEALTMPRCLHTSLCTNQGSPFLSRTRKLLSLYLKDLKAGNLLFMWGLLFLSPHIAINHWACQLLLIGNSHAMVSHTL